MRNRDAELLNARNAQTRVEKLKTNPKYETLIENYFCLCDYLHPNLGQNMILVRLSEKDNRAVKVTRDDPGIIETAIDRTARPMSLAARGTIQEFASLDFPFPNADSIT
jgi:hypothetical protein